MTVKCVAASSEFFIGLAGSDKPDFSRGPKSRRIDWALANLPEQGSFEGIDPSRAQELLRATLASRQFRDSPRQMALLSHLFAKEREGLGDRLSAYAIALDVLNRPASFDPAIDSIVRVEMHRLRGNLEAWANDSENTQPDQLTLRPRSYRLRITPRANFCGRKSRQTGSPALWRRLRWVWLVLALTVAGLAFLSLRSTTSNCHSARPIITLAGPVEGASSSLSAAMLAQFKTMVRNYPLASFSHDAEGTCTGVPTFKVRLRAQPQGKALYVHVDSVDLQKAVLDKEIPLYPSNKDADLAIPMAQVAYLLANSDSGVVPVNALRTQWGRKDAEQEYRCLMLAHQYFLTSTAESFFNPARDCLIRYYKSSTKADIPAMLAALELEREFRPMLNSGKSENYLQRALKRSLSIDSYNYETLFVRLKYSRTKSHLDSGDSLTIIEIMQQTYPYEPHVLHQIAMTECWFTERFFRGLRNLKLARSLSLGNVKGEYATAFCNIGLGRDRENRQLADFMVTDLAPSTQLAVLQIADANDDKVLVDLAVKNLRDAGCGTLACARKTLDDIRAGPTLDRRMMDAARKHLVS